MRQIVLDTETTGLDPKSGHRVIEIGCVELINRKFTGNHYHVYLNPEREVDSGAFKVHGISNLFLDDKPLFKDVFSEFIAFIDNAELIIHNAPFDIGFLNSEFKYINYKKNIEDHCSILDTLVYARNKHSGQRNTLDALCKRYNVNNSNRQLHGALLDAEILAFVYLAMTGGQAELFEDINNLNATTNNYDIDASQQLLQSVSPVYFADENELKLHDEFMAFLDK